jgi:hypothetical protein
VGTLLHYTASRLHATKRPADFGTGVLHGALMPLALPNLLAGDDVTIYAEKNSGRGYKLGYATGVNACGLLFFGVFFWRIGRWRRSPHAKGS